MTRPALAPVALLALGLLLSGGCGSRKRKAPPPQVGPHPKVAPVDYSWVREAWRGHPFLELTDIAELPHRLPGRARVDLRLRRLQSEGVVRREIHRVHRVHVAPDTRMKSATYVVRGLGDAEWGVLIGNWARGDLPDDQLRWSHPEGP